MNRIFLWGFVGGKAKPLKQPKSDKKDAMRHSRSLEPRHRRDLLEVVDSEKREEVRVLRPKLCIVSMLLLVTNIIMMISMMR
ncbi:hypothetical protein I3760_02G008200 [Carya illinoinensis]|nr:hypothetical protein I3760_02G008200 [Carya illinoinensis]